MATIKEIISAKKDLKCTKCNHPLQLKDWKCPQCQTTTLRNLKTSEYGSFESSYILLALHTLWSFISIFIALYILITYISHESYPKFEPYMLVAILMASPFLWVALMKISVLNKNPNPNVVRILCLLCFVFIFSKVYFPEFRLNFSMIAILPYVMLFFEMKKVCHDEFRKPLNLIFLSLPAYCVFYQKWIFSMGFLGFPLIFIIVVLSLLSPLLLIIATFQLFSITEKCQKYNIPNLVAFIAFSEDSSDEMRVYELDENAPIYDASDKKVVHDLEEGVIYIQNDVYFILKNDDEE